jgi:putative chitinase
LSASLASRIDASILRAIAPRTSGARAKRQAEIIDRLGYDLPRLLEPAAITTPLRIAHFLAQLAHESDGFSTTVEYAPGDDYEGREDLGNIKPGDGRRYKGRGPIQLTGRANYSAFSLWMRRQFPDAPDFEAKPTLVAIFPWAAFAAVFFWQTNGLNALADRDDLVAVTKRINGGRNGLADRASYLSKVKPLIAGLAGNDLSERQQFAVLVRGMSGEPVERIQRSLQAAGFYFLTIDGVFGAGTEGAVMAFQRARGLVVDGIVGGQTAAALSHFSEAS